MLMTAQSCQSKCAIIAGITPGRRIKVEHISRVERTERFHKHTFPVIGARIIGYQGGGIFDNSLCVMKTERGRRSSTKVVIIDQIGEFLRSNFSLKP